MTQLLAAKPDVDHAITLLAHNIVRDFKNQRPLFVALLRGAMPFASKLMFAIAQIASDFHPELDYMTLSTYGNERTAGKLTVLSDLSPKTTVTGRTVIVLDDVIDQGITAAFAFDYLRQRGAANVKLATLIEKDIKRSNIAHADYTCFHTGPEWLTGMGLDDTSIQPEANRWLNEVRVVDN